jgi:hypothetical protein
VNLPAVLWAHEEAVKTASEKALLLVLAIRCDALGAVRETIPALAAAACQGARTVEMNLASLRAAGLIEHDKSPGRVKAIVLRMRTTPADSAASPAAIAGVEPEMRTTPAAIAGVGSVSTRRRIVSTQPPQPMSTPPQPLRGCDTQDAACSAGNTPAAYVESPATAAGVGRVPRARGIHPDSLGVESDSADRALTHEGGASRPPPKVLPESPVQIQDCQAPALALVPPAAPRDEVAEAFAAWNRIAGPVTIKAVGAIGTDRTTGLRRMLRELGGLAGWEAFCARVAAAPHLRGENDREWRASLAWVLKPANARKIMEGNYDPRGAARRPDPKPQRGGSIFDEGGRFDDIRAEMERMAREEAGLPPEDPPHHHGEAPGMDDRPFIDSTAEESAP